MKKLIYIIISLTFITGNSFAKKASMFTSLQLSLRMGYQLLSESDEWRTGREKMLNEDVFLRNDSNFKSTNVDTAQTNGLSGLPIFQVEGIMGINLGKFSRKLKKIKGFRMGYAFTLYPFASTTTYEYGGALTYTDPSAADPALQTKNYNGSIKIQDSMLLMGHTMSFYYFYEKGFLSRTRKNKLIPYGGFEVGIGILNGKRKLQMTTDPLSITTLADGTNNYQINSTIQESFFNSISFRIAPVIGAQYHISGPHYLDIKIGFNIESASMNLDRDGVVTEKATDPATNNLLYTYSQKVAESGRNSVYSQSGLFFLIGYTVGLK